MRKRHPRGRRISNLPHSLTSFVGREREIAEVRALLGRTRLLTLTGAGGIGKTRLGHEVAADLLGEYPGGVWLVELAELADPDLVTQAVATVLGVQEEADRPLIAALTEAHQRDLEVQDKYGVTYMRYWFDEGTGKVFCLAEGPSKEACEAVHREAHGLLADQITEVQEGA